MKIITAVTYLTLIVACDVQKTASTASGPDTSQNALDWVGVYKGFLPCADCEGINTSIHLKKDLTYVKHTQYAGKSLEHFTQQGSFQWNTAGNAITLMPWVREGLNEDPDTKIEVRDEFKIQEQYLVGENHLKQLDKNGNPIAGALAAKYMLLKVDVDADICEKYWKLIELSGKAIVSPKDQKREAHFMLKRDGNQMKGHGGCNQFSGTYSLTEGNRLHFSQMASTDMACEDAEYESEFLNAFQNTDNYSLKGDTLSLNKARMAPMAKFVVVYFR